MSRGREDEQFRFLISCIRHANNNKVDFAAVADECHIVSKGAAAKRYERLMRAHGIASTPPGNRPMPVASLARREAPVRREDPERARKRKLGELESEHGSSAVDDEHNDGIVTVKTEEMGFGVKAEAQNANAEDLCIIQRGWGYDGPAPPLPIEGWPVHHNPIKEHRTAWPQEHRASFEFSRDPAGPYPHTEGPARPHGHMGRPAGPHPHMGGSLAVGSRTMDDVARAPILPYVRPSRSSTDESPGTRAARKNSMVETIVIVD